MSCRSCSRLASFSRVSRRRRTSSEGIICTLPESISSIRRLISSDQAASTPSSDGVSSRLSRSDPAKAARAPGGGARAFFRSSETSGLMVVFYASWQGLLPGRLKLVPQYNCYTFLAMYIYDLIPLITALAPYSWPFTVLILAWAFHNRIKEITEAKLGDKLYVKWGDVPSDRKLDQALGETPPHSATKQLGVRSGAKWENVGNLFWLGGDLIWTAQSSLRGAPKEKILHGLKQSYHHICELGLAESAPAKQLLLLKSETASLPETALDRAWRSTFSEKIYDVTRTVNNLLGEQQSGFRPNPQN